MKKYLFIMLLSSSCSFSSFCQPSEWNRKDSLYLDSLRRVLPGLKDSLRVDCLNSLSEKSIFWRGSFKPEDFARTSDSMYKYASLAYQEATRLQYKFGLAHALLNLRNSYKSRTPLTNDSIYEKAVKDSLIMKYGNRALLLAKETGNDELLGDVYASGLQIGTYIENCKKAIFYYRKAGDKKKELDVTINLIEELGLSNEETLSYATNCLQLIKEFTPITWEDHSLVTTTFQNMANIFKQAGDYESALSYMMESDRYSRKSGESGSPLAICELYYLRGNYDTAYQYWQVWKKDYNSYWYGHRSYGDALLGKIYLKTTQLDKAIDMFNISLEANRKDGKYDTLVSHTPIIPLIYLGEAYYQKNDYRMALYYARQGLVYANRVGDVSNLEAGNEIISRIYHQLGINDSAYNCLLRHVYLKDSIQNRQFLFKLFNYKKAAEDAKKEARIGFLNRDNEIKKQELKQEATFRKFLLAVFMAIVLAGMYVIRIIIQRRKNEKRLQEQKEQEWELVQLENEKKQIEFQKRAAELEMQALRAQMNPHFIFNCLSSINQFILKNDSKSASNYLTRFSRLMRMVLMNSQRPMITLDDELQMLEIYLEMERLRFRNSFDYAITFLNAIDSDNVFIPPLLLQPFCENAIWHGLMHKDEPGRLSIELSMQDKILVCCITDNGVGRGRAGELNSKSAEKQKSMGLKITTERLALINNEKGMHTSYEVFDLENEQGIAMGTKIILKISSKEFVEEEA
jgi:hypothetical protein